MHIGVLTTSWPHAAATFAGSFVASQVQALAGAGDRIRVCTSDRAGLHVPTHAGIELLKAPSPSWAALAGQQRSPSAWLGAVARGAALPGLVRTAQALHPDEQLGRRLGEHGPAIWLCHWWPLSWAAPSGAPRVTVLHGSDVDLLERLVATARSLPRGAAAVPTLRRQVALRAGTVVAVAPELSARFGAAMASAPPPVLALGAGPAHHGPTGEGAPTGAAWWWEAAAPRVLTVAREAPGKGLGCARRAARRLPGVAWQIVTPAMGLGPAEVERLLARADLLVVPSLRGSTARGLPSEGQPHVIAEALAGGTPVLAGPNAACRTAARRYGQAEVATEGAAALAAAVVRALGERRQLRARAARAAIRLQWPVAIHPWRRVLAQAIAEHR